mgnify:CR=1 FL=1
MGWTRAGSGVQLRAMSPTFYHVLHLISVLVLTGYTFYAFAAPAESRKKVMIITGVASLLVLCLFLPACFAVWPLPTAKRDELGQEHAEARIVSAILRIDEEVGELHRQRQAFEWPDQPAF